MVLRVREDLLWDCTELFSMASCTSGFHTQSYGEQRKSKTPGAESANSTQMEVKSRGGQKKENTAARSGGSAVCLLTVFADFGLGPRLLNHASLAVL